MNGSIWRIGVALLVALALTACGRNSSDSLLASGKDLLEKRDYRGAVIQFKSALQKDGDNAQARFYLGKVLLATGDPVAATVELRKAQDLQWPEDQLLPELARAMLLTGQEAQLIAQHATVNLSDPVADADLKTSLATAYATQRDPEKARLTAEEALQAKPGYAPAIIVLARLRAVGDDVDGAIALLDQVLAAEPANDHAGLLKGDLLLYGKNDTDAAVAIYRKVLAGSPDSVLARSSIANILLQKGQLDAVRIEFEELKKRAPRHPETLTLEARLAFVDKDYKRARETADQILKAMPDNVRVLELAGAAEFRMNGYLQAEALLGRALKLAPGQAVTRLMLAQTYLRSGQADKTIEVLRPVFESGKADATTLSVLGEAYLQLGDAKRSEEAFQRAVRAAPQDSRVRTSAAIALMARGNASGAAAELESVAAADTSPRADLALVSARLRQGDLVAALKAVDGLEKKMPDRPLPQFLRGRLLAMKKDLPAATKSFEAALAKDAGYFPAVAALAALDLAAGRRDDARKRFDAQLTAQPKSWQAKLALAELDARTGAPTSTVVASLREAVTFNPSEPRSRLVLINTLISSGDAKAALQAAQEGTAALPSNLDLLDAQGRAELAAGDHQRAISTFKRLASLQPRQAIHEMRLAEAYLTAKDNDAARRSLRRAMELKPDLFAPRRALALLDVQENRPDDGLAIAREARARYPNDAAAYVLEADIESSRKNWEAAAASYRSALQRAPGSTEVAIRLHAALTAGAKTSEADRFAGDWIKSHAKDAAFLYYLGDGALAKNDLAAAEARYRAVLDAQPDNALAMNNLAWLLAKQKRPGALAMAEKAVQLMPERGALLDTLSTVLEANNDLPRAIDAQKRAIAADPKDWNFTLRLAKLYIKSGDKDRARAELEALVKLGDKVSAQDEVASLLKSL